MRGADSCIEPGVLGRWLFDGLFDGGNGESLAIELEAIGTAIVSAEEVIGKWSGHVEISLLSTWNQVMQDVILPEPAIETGILQPIWIDKIDAFMPFQVAIGFAMQKRVHGIPHC